MAIAISPGLQAVINQNPALKWLENYQQQTVPLARIWIFTGTCKELWLSEETSYLTPCWITSLGLFWDRQEEWRQHYLPDSCQALKIKEFFCWDCSGKNLKTQGAHQALEKSSHELQTQKPENCRVPAYTLILFQAVTRVKISHAVSPQSHCPRDNIYSMLSLCFTPKHVSGSITAVPPGCSSPGAGAEFQVCSYLAVCFHEHSKLHSVIYVSSQEIF